MLRFAARTFEILPCLGFSAGGPWQQAITEVYATLKSSVFLLEENSRLIVILTSHFITDYHCVSSLIRRSIADALHISSDQVFCFSSHNHCAPRLHAKDRPPFGLSPSELLHAEEELTAEGLELLRLATQCALELHEKLRPVEVRFGVGKERRITHNRKGRRADGSTYLMREEDRLHLGEDFTGDIDDDAFVIGFYQRNGIPLGFLTQFTGHPVTAYHCDRPIVWAEYPQIACDDLSAEFGNVPVGFLQGCAGDTNSKGLLSTLTVEESLRRSENYGHQLGHTFIKVTENLRPSEKTDLQWRWRYVHLPYQSVPPISELESRLRQVEAFLQRCEAGEETTTRICDGLNFPRNMKIASRAMLMEPTRKWLHWALSFHRENRLHSAPRGLDLLIAALRVGDVGLVGLPGEPLMGIGRQIKKASPLRMTVPCGYMHEGQDTCAYIPDGPNCGDLDYCSSYYRYTDAMLPFRKPAGDLLAHAAVDMLKETLESAPSPENSVNHKDENSLSIAK